MPGKGMYVCTQCSLLSESQPKISISDHLPGHTHTNTQTHTHTEEVIQINNSNNHLLVSKTGPDCNYPFSKSSRHPKPRHDDTHLYSQHWGGRSRMSLWVQSQPGLHSKSCPTPLSPFHSPSLCVYTHTHTHTHTRVLFSLQEGEHTSVSEE